MNNSKSATVTWLGDALNFTAVTGSGFEIPVSSGGNGASPMDYLLVGVAGCTAIDVVSILQKMRQPIAGLRVEIEAARADTHPKVFTHAVMTYIISGDVTHAAAARAIELSKERYCSASVMFKEAGVTFEVDHRIEPARPSVIS